MTIVRMLMCSGTALCLLGLVCALGSCAATTYTYTPGVESCPPFKYGHQVHIVFGYEGTQEDADKMFDAADHGICDDPRVQRFVDILREDLEARWFAARPENNDYKWLPALNEPRSIWGKLSDAERVEDPSGKEPFLYQWTDPSSNVRVRASESKFRRHYAKGTAIVQMGRRGGPRGSDCINLTVAGGSGWTRAVPALRHRNASFSSHGVMGIVVAKDSAELPPGPTIGARVTLSGHVTVPAELIDEIMIAALNRALRPHEVVQFYRHASLSEFGDSDERVAVYMESVKNAVLIKRPEGD